MSRASEINTKIDDAVTYIEAENWSAARTKLIAAQALMASVPESQFDGAMLRYRDTITDLLAQVKAQQGRGLGVQRTKLSFAPVLEEDDYA